MRRRFESKGRGIAYWTTSTCCIPARSPIPSDRISHIRHWLQGRGALANGLVKRVSMLQSQLRVNETSFAIARWGMRRAQRLRWSALSFFSKTKNMSNLLIKILMLVQRLNFCCDCKNWYYTKRCPVYVIPFSLVLNGMSSFMHFHTTCTLGMLS